MWDIHLGKWLFVQPFQEWEDGEVRIEASRKFLLQCTLLTQKMNEGLGYTLNPKPYAAVSSSCSSHQILMLISNATFDIS